MQKEKQRVLTPEILRLHNQVMEDLESGMLEQDLGIVLNDIEVEEDTNQNLKETD